ncbi:hypothetical protein BTO20_16300 [Mycobacterium dioxanotrophicus]|uniref:Helix-turn-helix domain-containing protein n=1 Tax=Mycobacterium dioxanotrophicus TaxID=482462 RepID=A0A1Y0C409_9MYCO|nr:helix-turn-helix domain-containing protein [Mycobacterium dioxanotrophicus]ART69928.1 hypothetical protein BTO20_16300 [Mycobacterium dioxanotrophicus]
MTKLLTYDDVADVLGIPRATLKYWRHSGNGPKCARIGRHVFYRKADVETWLSEQFSS